MVFEADKKRKRQSIHFNKNQKDRAVRLAKIFRYEGKDDQPNISRTVHTATYLAERYMKIREKVIEKIIVLIKKWDITIPELFDIGEREPLYQKLTKQDKNKFITLSTKPHV